MKKIIVFIVVAALVLVFTPALIYAGNGDAFDNWKGTLGFVDVERNSEYDNPSGHVILNYNSGKDEWVVNVVAKGLNPEIKYEVMFMNGPIIPLGCGYPNANGVLHINAKGFTGEIDPTITFSAGAARVNVRLANDDCSGKSDSAVLTTVLNWGGTGLVPVGSNRPE